MRLMERRREQNGAGVGGELQRAVTCMLGEKTCFPHTPEQFLSIAIVPRNVLRP